MGNWETDCVVGRQGSQACLLVLTERVSRKQIIEKMEDKTQNSVKAILDQLEREYAENFPKILKTITSDNGSEFLDSDKVEGSVGDVLSKRTIHYFAHPYCAWERGTNEVNNKLIRRFIPRGVDIGVYSIEDIKRIEHWMNHYPRRLFQYKSANEIWRLRVSRSEACCK